MTIITGAGGGMGRACVERFRDGRLLLVDIDEWALARATDRDAGGLDRPVHLAGVSPTMDNAERILEVDLAGTAALAALTAVRPG